MLTNDQHISTTCVADAEERRGDSRRVKAAQTVRVRSTKTGIDDVETTVNVSRHGLYFTTRRASYFLGMRVLVTVPYSPDGGGIEYFAEVARMQVLPGDLFGVALRLLQPSGA